MTVPALPPTFDTAKATAPRVTNEDLEKRFTYHAPKPGQPEIYQSLREQAKALAYAIVEKVPPGREQASALTFLENAIFWANAGIARNG